MSLENKFRQNEINPLQPKKEVTGSSGLKEVRNKNHLLLPKNDQTPSTENEENTLKREREKNDAEDNSLLKKLKKGIGLHDDKENHDPRSSEIGPNGQGDAAQLSKEIGQITEELKRTPELRDKFDKLHTQILEIDPKIQEDATQLSKEIERIRENLEITPEEFQKFNRLLDAIPPDEQEDQKNGESPKVKGTRNSQKNEVNGEERSSEMPKVTQADLDELAKKIESSKRNWETFMELMRAMQTPGSGY